MMRVITPNSLESRILYVASTYIGARYLQHASPLEACTYHTQALETTGSGLCCSGLILAVAKGCGIELPPLAMLAKHLYTQLPPAQPHPGALVFFTTQGYTGCHVGILTNTGVIHSSRELRRVDHTPFEKLHNLYPTEILNPKATHKRNPIGYRCLTTIITRNVDHFKRVPGLKVETW